MNENNKAKALEVKDLYVSFDVDDQHIQAVNGVSFTLNPGQTLGLVGETGAGKTTTALACLRLIEEPPGSVRSGGIILGGRDISHATQKQMQNIRGNEISMIFQDPMTSLNPVFTVGDQIAEAILLHEDVTREEAAKKAMDMLELVGIPADRAGEYPHQFSGGMKQRVIIAIALACNPKVLIADEPTTALDVTIQAQVLDLIHDLKSKFKTAMLLITHDLGIVAEVCEQVAVMYAGRIIEFGSLKDVFTNTRHPYTEGLFGSLPNIRQRTEQLQPIKGIMPDPTNLPPGCSFSPRCNYAVPACAQDVPQPIQAGEGHYVCCSRYLEESFRIKRSAT